MATKTTEEVDKGKALFEKEVREMFELFDKNGDNSITADEMGKVLRGLGFEMSNKEIKAAVKQIDINRNGTIEYGEFRRFMIKQHKQTLSEGDTQKEIRQAFRLFDRNGNGFIEKAELRKAMCTLGEPLTESELDIMMREADKNNDGKIDYSEFTRLWTKKGKEHGQT